MSFHFVKQLDAMQCGVACLAMICKYYNNAYSIETLSEICSVSKEGVSLQAMISTAQKLGFHSVCGKTTIEQIANISKPCILHWNQNHFVVLYKVKKNNKFHIADPGKGLICYSLENFKKHWISSVSNGQEKGIVMFIEPTDNNIKIKQTNKLNRKCTFNFLYRYILQYRKYFVHIFIGLLLGCLLQLILPFLTQAIVDVGIRHGDIGFIWLVLLGELLIVTGRTATDFIRRWLLLHISMRVNISLVSDFFIKLLRLPMSFFDTKLIGDLLQRIGDHSRVQKFLTSQLLGILFAMLSFIVFGIVLLIYNRLIFVIFLAGSSLYGVWIARFLSRRKVIDYELFEQQAINNNRTYQFLASMQEIKLQDCEQRRRWEWEDTQADLFRIQMKSLKLQQTQEAGSIFINEVKNILITVFAATAVIDGEISLGAMLAI